MMKFKNLILFYVAIDLVLIAVAEYFGDIYLLNSQVAMICSMLILFASYLGYKSRVDTKSVNYQLSDQEKAFFEDDWDASEPSEQQDLKQVLKKLRKKTKFNKMDFIGAFKPFRLVAYITLIVAFFMLLRRDLFEPFSFLGGLVVMPLGVFLAGVFTRDRN
ncbi:hypothetical protein [Campylobacter iguaniorum]|uniref:hypothetical protein n=1 Tax=Campylobacter iguaniorum TaxID=1244531 RepID=UPI0007C970AA|nr:hypothetical protein [Campylobacter iguaniorum]